MLEMSSLRAAERGDGNRGVTSSSEQRAASSERRRRAAGAALQAPPAAHRRVPRAHRRAGGLRGARSAPGGVLLRCRRHGCCLGSDLGPAGARWGWDDSGRGAGRLGLAPSAALPPVAATLCRSAARPALPSSPSPLQVQVNWPAFVPCTRLIAHTLPAGTWPAVARCRIPRALGGRRPTARDTHDAPNCGCALRPRSWLSCLSRLPARERLKLGSRQQAVSATSGRARPAGGGRHWRGRPACRHSRCRSRLAQPVPRASDLPWHVRGRVRAASRRLCAPHAVGGFCGVPQMMKPPAGTTGGPYFPAAQPTSASPPTSCGDQQARAASSQYAEVRPRAALGGRLQSPCAAPGGKAATH